MQLVEILSHSNKIKTVDDLLNHFDSIVELARDDIYKIAKSKRLKFSDFEVSGIVGTEVINLQKYTKVQNESNHSQYLSYKLFF